MCDNKYTFTTQNLLEYQNKLEKILGTEKASEILTTALEMIDTVIYKRNNVHYCMLHNKELVLKIQSDAYSIRHAIVHALIRDTTIQINKEDLEKMFK